MNEIIILHYDECDIHVTRDKICEVITELSHDEVFDAINRAMQNCEFHRQSVFERICDDYKDELCELLQKFWERRSDACPLEAIEHEKQIEEWQDWIDAGMPKTEKSE